MPPRLKIAKSLKYFWLNWLNRGAQLKFLGLSSGAKALGKSVSFAQQLDGFRRVIVILPRDPLEVLLTQRCLVALKEHRPGMKIEVVAETGAKDIIESNPYLDGGLFYAANEFYYDHPGFQALTASLKAREWDACFLMNEGNNPLHLLLAAHTRAPLRVGFADRDLFPFVNLAVRPKRETVHEADRYAVLLKMAGVKMSRSRIQWQVPKTAVKDLEGLLAEAGYDFKGRLVGIDAGPSLAGKGLPPALLKQLSEAAQELTGAPPVLVSSANPGKGADRESKSGGRGIVPLYRESLSVTAALAERCDLLVAPNSLLYHFAVLLNRPVVGIFEEEEAARWASEREGRCEVVSEKKLKESDAVRVIGKMKGLLGTPVPPPQGEPRPQAGEPVSPA